MRISLDRYGSKKRKASRYRSTVSNETILATKQEFLFTKVALVQSITDIILLDFWLILLPWMFISSCTTIYFFAKNFFFLNIYISVNTIFRCSYLLFGWEIGHLLSTNATGGMEGESSKMCTGAYRGRRLKYQSSDTYVLNGWPQANVVEYFLCIGSAKYTRASLPAKKTSLYYVVTSLFYPMG